MLKDFFSGVSAGLLISIGCTVYLSCDNKYVGAVLFSVALLCICYMGYSLYTGRIGFVLDSHKKSDIASLLLGLGGNLLSTFAFGLLVSFTLPGISQTAKFMCASKFTQLLPQTFFRAFFCGVLMYLAVGIFRKMKSITGILFCIPVFILSGFEHSIADMFYFSVSKTFEFKTALFILTVIIGNSVGSLILPLLALPAQRKAKEKNEND